MPSPTIRLVAFVCLVAASLQATAQETLQWKFRSKETLKYSVIQNMNTVQKIGDQTRNAVMNQAMDMSWQVLGMSANGEVVMNQVVNRIRMKMDNGAAGVIEFDTQSEKKPENPAIARMSETFAKIVSQPFQVSMKPTGKISDVKVPEGLLAAIKQNAAGNAAALDEKTLQQMMKQSAVTLPGQAVGPNSTWNSTESIQLPFGTMKIESTMTYLQKDDQGNAIIDIQPSISVEPREGAPVSMTLTSSEGRGQVTFSIANGRVLKSRLDLTLAMKISGPGGQTIEQTIKQTTAMTLAE